MDLRHHYILAHYNWHRMKPGVSLDETRIEHNLDSIRDVMQVRIDRMLEMCSRAKKIMLLALNHDGYEFIQINARLHPIGDLSIV